MTTRGIGSDQVRWNEERTTLPDDHLWLTVSDAVRDHCRADAAGIVRTRQGGAIVGEGEPSERILVELTEGATDTPSQHLWNEPGQEGCCAGIAVAVDGDPVVLWVKRHEPLDNEDLHRLRSIAQLVTLLHRADCAREEAELLLREAQHRSANDLQLVGSLVSHQAHLTPDPQASAALARAAARVTTLQLARRASSGNIAAALANLLTALRAQLDEEQIVLHLTIEGELPPLNERAATPIMIAVNELVTNAIKHAFPDGRRGAIRVGLAAAGDGLRVSVVDDGAPFDHHAGARQPGAGLDLVRQVIAAARGRFSLPDDGAKAFVIDMPLAAASAHLRVTKGQPADRPAAAVAGLTRSAEVTNPSRC